MDINRNRAMFSHTLREQGIKMFFFMAAASSVVAMGLITVYLFLEGAPLFLHITLEEFFLGMHWYPTATPAEFGIFPLIVASFAVTILSSLLAIPLGVMTAIYLAEIASPRLRSICKPAIEMLAALPSVVLGFFGMVVLAPVLQDYFDIAIGLNLFSASLMLAFMSVPTICTIAEDAIYSVPGHLKEASLALGATHFETIGKVTLPAALSGISTGVILGMSRAIGETMLTLMVAGGAAIIPTSLFDPVRPLPASIAAEMAETPVGSDHYHALFAIGVTLFLFTLIFNLIAAHISYKYKQTGASTL